MDKAQNPAERPDVRANAERSGQSRDDRIAITGVGMTTCLGEGARECWKQIQRGVSGLGRITRFDTGDYPISGGGEAPRLPERSGDGPEEILRLERTCQEALDDARDACGPPADDGRMALVVGSSLAGSSTGEAFFRSYLERGPSGADYARLEGYYMEASLERLARRFGIRGPSVLVSNACAAGGSSIARGASLIESGRADRVLCAGYDPLSIFTFAGFGSLMALTPTAVRPFSRTRDGMLLGDGYACLVLERSRDVHRRGSTPRAFLSGRGESTDSHHLTHPHPEGSGAALAMRRALARSCLAPEAIGYVNCHGTATRPNDSAEGKALRAVFGARLETLPVSSSKPFFGHTLGGAGTVEAVVTILALENQFLPPTLNLDEVDPELGKMDLVRVGREASFEHAMSNNFGFGGSNVSLVFSRAEPSAGAEP